MGSSRNHGWETVTAEVVVKQNPAARRAAEFFFISLILNLLLNEVLANSLVDVLFHFEHYPKAPATIG